MGFERPYAIIASSMMLNDPSEVSDANHPGGLLIMVKS